MTVYTSHLTNIQEGVSPDTPSCSYSVIELCSLNEYLTTASNVHALLCRLHYTATLEIIHC